MLKVAYSKKENAPSADAIESGQQEINQEEAQNNNISQNEQIDLLNQRILKLLRKNDEIKNQCQARLDDMERDYNTKIEYVFKLKKYQIFDGSGDCAFCKGKKDQKNQQIQVEDNLENEQHLKMIMENFNNMKKVELL